MKASSLGGGLGGFKQFLSISGPLAPAPLLATKARKNSARSSVLLESAKNADARPARPRRNERKDRAPWGYSTS